MSKITLRQVVGRTLSIGRVVGQGAIAAWGGLSGNLKSQTDLVGFVYGNTEVRPDQFENQSTDIGKMYAALDRVIAMSSGSAEGDRPVLNLAGRRYDFTEPFIVEGIEGLVVRNGSARLTGGAWQEDDFAFGSLAPQTLFEKVVVDGNRVAGGFDIGSGRVIAQGCNVFHFRGTAYRLEGSSGDGRLIDCEHWQWNSGDDEWEDDGQFDGVGIFVNRPDVRVHGHLGRWCGLNFEAGPDCRTFMGSSLHMFNGRPAEAGVPKRIRPLNLRMRPGSSGRLVNTYLDNGSILLENTNWEFGGENIVLYNPDACTLDYIIGIRQDDTNNPFDVDTGDWQPVSPTVSGTPGVDGAVPLVLTLPKLDGNGNEVARFLGDYSRFEARAGVKRLRRPVVVSKNTVDDKPVFWAHSPGFGRRNGARYELVSGDTPDYALVHPAALFNLKGTASLHRGVFCTDDLAGDTTYGLEDTFRITNATNTSPAVHTLPADAEPGWFRWISLAAGAASLTLRSDPAQALSKLLSGGLAGPVLLNAPGSVALVFCQSNNTARNGAQFVFFSGGAAAESERVSQ